MIRQKPEGSHTHTHTHWFKKCNTSHKPQHLTEILRFPSDLFHISWLEDFFSSRNRFVKNPTGFYNNSGQHCDTLLASFWKSNSCRVIPVSDLAFGFNSEPGRQSSAKTCHTADKAHWHSPSVPAECDQTQSRETKWLQDLIRKNMFFYSHLLIRLHWETTNVPLAYLII